MHYSLQLSLLNNAVICVYVLAVAVSSVDFFEVALPRIPNLRGVKHTTPSFPNMHMLLAKFGRRVDVVQGNDSTYLEGLAIGIEGVIMQSYVGLALKRVKEAFDRGDLTAARQDQVPAVSGRPGGWGSRSNDDFAARCYA